MAAAVPISTTRRCGGRWRFDGRDGAALGKSHGNLRGSDVLRKFGNGQKIEAARGEKRGVDGAAELLEGSANHSETVLHSVRQMAPSLIGETNLEAVVGHGGLDSGGGPWVLGIQPCAGAARVSSEKNRYEREFI